MVSTQIRNLTLTLRVKKNLNLLLSPSRQLIFNCHLLHTWQGSLEKFSVFAKSKLCFVSVHCSGHLVVQDTLFKSEAEILWHQRFICSMNECYKRPILSWPVFISRPVDPTHLGKNRVHGSCDVLKFSVLVIEEVQDDNIIGDLSESRRESKGNSGERMLLASSTL